MTRGIANRAQGKPDRWLALVRAAWVIVALLSLVVMIAGFPISLETLRTPCVEPQCTSPIGPEAESGFQQLGLSLDAFAVFFTVLFGTVSLGFFAAAGLLVWRRSHDRFALFVSLYFVLQGSEVSSQFRAELVAQQPLWRWPVAALLTLTSVLFLLLPYLFPDGRFVPRRMRWIAVIMALVVTMANVFPQSPMGPSTWSPWLNFLVMAGLIGGGVFAQIYRYRRVSGPVERQQTKWVVLGFTALVLIQSVHFGWFTPVVFPALDQGTPQGMTLLLLDGGIATLSLLLLPVSIGFAILRYRLWDIDILIRRALQYSVLTGLLAALYIGGVIVSQAGMVVVTGQESSPVATVITTLGIAALFTPLRRRIQDGIDRRFFRKKYDAQQVLAKFAITARDETDLDALADELVRVVQETMQPERVSVWLKPTQTRPDRFAIPVRSEPASQMGEQA